MMETEQERIYLSCADTAKLVRNDLKKHFPQTKFSVRSSVYSMGSSIDVSWTDVSWTDGPGTEQVNKVVKIYEGAGFDGSIDLKFYKRHWLMPNGQVLMRGSEGTEDSRGYYSKWDTEQPEGAKEISMGSDYVMTNRHLSEEISLKCAEVIAKEENIPYDPSDLSKSFDWNNEYWNMHQVLWRFLRDLDLTNFKELKVIPLFCGDRFGGYEVIRNKPLIENKEELRPELIIKGNCVRCNQSKALFNVYCSKCMHEVWKEKHK
jgi:hypothetical protein